MPEGHTLHRLARTLSHAFGGTRPEVTSPQGRFVEGAAELDGRLCEGAEAWGKHLFVTFEDDRILNVHLGLIGVFDVTRYAVSGPAVPPPVGAVRVRLLTDEWVADLRGATLVEVVTPEQLDTTVARLGPDPLRAGQGGNDPQRALDRLARTNRSIAESLMDQSVIAGVGNLYRAEVLWRHRVAPFTPGKQVKAATFLELWDDLVRLLPLGVAFGQILTLEDQVEEAEAMIARGDDAAYQLWQGRHETEVGRGRGQPAYETGAAFPREFAVYKRTGLPCPRCGSRIRTQVLAGRNLFWCGRCQRRR